ncbi:MAG: hypothetical protein Q4G49_03280 [Paracoccus sp. (in: a-proteobacteria)]|nr:hypothetical protein [Paracoccus sp. (in: a-proteobacteria)]
MFNWLDTRLGRGHYAQHAAASCPAAGRVLHRIAIYFRHPADTAAFVAAFPDVDLADGTILPTYTSPYRR